MPVKIDTFMTAKELHDISLMRNDYKVLYEALKEISKMVSYSYAPREMQLVADYALRRVKTIGGE